MPVCSSRKLSVSRSKGETVLLSDENDEETFNPATVTRYRDGNEAFKDEPAQPTFGENRIAITLGKSIDKQSDYDEVASGND